MNIFNHINKQAALTALLVVVFLAGAFFYYLGGDTSSNSVLSEQNGAGVDAALGKDLLIALAQLKSTTLDTALFKDPIFVALKDWSIEIAPQPVGRRNPFALFDGASAGKSAGTKKTILPLLPKKTTASSTPSAPQGGGGFDLQ